MFNIVSILLLVVLAFGVILLQIFLSKRNEKWFGLILPGISFLVSLIIVGSIIAYANIGITSHSISEGGRIVSHVLDDTRAGFGSVVSRVIVTFLFTNSFTVILIVIYAVCREKRKQQLEIEKMQVQDLE